MSDDDKTQQFDPTPTTETPTDSGAPAGPLTIPARPATTEEPMDTDRVTTPVTTPTSSTSSTAAPEVWTTATAEARGVRVGTVVWGLVIAAIGVGLLAFASGVTFDVELALIVLVAAAGVALLVGSLVNGMKRRGR